MKIIYKIFVSFFIFGVTKYLSLVTSYSTGAPESKCDTMIPGHFAGKIDEPCPFYVAIDKVNVTGGQSIGINLSSSTDTMFKGFFVMVRKNGGDTSYGSFLPESDPEKAQGVACFKKPNSAMTHISNKGKKRVSLIWIAPESAKDQQYEVVVTFVQSFWTLWAAERHPEKIRVARTLPDDSKKKNNVRRPQLEQTKPNPTPVTEGTSLFQNIVNQFFGWLQNV